MRISCRAVAGLWLLALLAGCESGPRMSYDSVGLVDVSGTVTLDGKPLPGAVVIFEADTGRFSYGETDSSGRYTLHFDSETDGAAPGPKTVRISTSRKIGEEGEGGEGESAAKPPAERVPEKYNRKSELTRTIEPGHAQTFDFDLTTG